MLRQPVVLRSMNSLNVLLSDDRASPAAALRQVRPPSGACACYPASKYLAIAPMRSSVSGRIREPQSTAGVMVRRTCAP